MEEIILGVFWRILKEDFESFCIFACKIWWERNRVVHGGMASDSQTQVAFAENFLRESNLILHIEKMEIVSVLQPITRWCPPCLGTVKFNTDAAVVEGLGFVGVEMVYRNHVGEVLVACERRLYGHF